MAVKKRKRTMRQTSDKVSRFAGEVLGRMQQDMAIHGRLRSTCLYADPHELAALAASCLAQDQTKGKRKRARK